MLNRTKMNGQSLPAALPDFMEVCPHAYVGWTSYRVTKMLLGFGLVVGLLINAYAMRRMISTTEDLVTVMNLRGLSNSPSAPATKEN